MYFFLLLLLSTTKDPRHYILNKHGLWMMLRRQSSQGPQDLRNDMTVNSLSILFAIIYHRLQSEMLATHKYQCNRSLLSLAKGPRKEQASKTENFQTVTTLLQSHNHSGRKVQYHPHPYSCLQKPSRKPGLLPRRGYNTVSLCLHQ